MEANTINLLSMIFTGVSAVAGTIISVTAIIVSWKIGSKAASISEENSKIAMRQNEIAQQQSLISKEQNKLTNLQIKLTQRQLLVPLWEYIGNLQRLEEGSNKASWNKVIETANNLELLAISWDGGLIDGALLEGTLRDNFIERWEEILKYTTTISDNNGNEHTFKGEDLVKYNMAAHNKYEQLKQQKAQQYNVPKLEDQ